MNLGQHTVLMMTMKLVKLVLPVLKVKEPRVNVQHHPTQFVKIALPDLITVTSMTKVHVYPAQNVLQEKVPSLLARQPPTLCVRHAALVAHIAILRIRALAKNAPRALLVRVQRTLSVTLLHAEPQAILHVKLVSMAPHTAMLVTRQHVRIAQHAEKAQVYPPCVPLSAILHVFPVLLGQPTVTLMIRVLVRLVQLALSGKDRLTHVKIPVTQAVQLVLTDQHSVSRMTKLSARVAQSAPQDMVY